MNFADLANAIASETRREILAILGERENAVIGIGELAETLDIAASTASHHVDVLEHVGLVARIRAGREVLVESLGTVEIVLYPRPPVPPQRPGIAGHGSSG